MCPALSWGIWNYDGGLGVCTKVVLDTLVTNFIPISCTSSNRKSTSSFSPQAQTASERTRGSRLRRLTQDSDDHRSMADSVIVWNPCSKAQVIGTCSTMSTLSSPTVSSPSRRSHGLLERPDSRDVDGLTTVDVLRAKAQNDDVVRWKEGVLRTGNESAAIDSKAIVGDE